MKQRRKIVILGMGYLMEYIYPCYKRLLGEGAGELMAAVTADEKDLLRKQERFEFPVTLNDSSRVLEEMRPDLILFAPPPSAAPALVESVLVPYWEMLRAEGASLPALYAFPPRPTGDYYMEKLGNDLQVVNVLPNMVGSIAGKPITGEGLTYLTFPEGSPWPAVERAFLEDFFSPLGGCIEVKPAFVMQMLAGTVTVHNISDIILAISDALEYSGNPVDFHHIAGAMRAYHQQKWQYRPEGSTPCGEDEVGPELYQLLRKVTYHWFMGIYSFYLDSGMEPDTASRILVSLLDLHLHMHQRESREVIEANGRLHATKGGVLEKGRIIFERQAERELQRTFGTWPDVVLTDEWCSWLEQQAYSITAQVSDHSGSLTGYRKKQFCAEQHAVMFGLFARAVLDVCGDSGRELVKAGTEQYAHGRGYRMRLRCLRDHNTPDMLHYMAYGEWVPEPGTMEIRTRQKSPVNKTLVVMCPWKTAWKKYGLMDFAKYYCDYADFALVKGFHKSLELSMDSCMARGDAGCGFIWNGADLTEENEREIGRVKASNQKDGIMSWEYHTAHIYYAFCQVLDRNLDSESWAQVRSCVRREFARLFGARALEAVDGYAETDFLALPQRGLSLKED